MAKDSEALKLLPAESKSNLIGDLRSTRDFVFQEAQKADNAEDKEYWMSEARSCARLIEMLLKD